MNPSQASSPSGQTPLLGLLNIEVVFEQRMSMFSRLTKGQSRQIRAVDGVDLEVRQGEVVALVGQSGCGKTTLARTIMGLQPARRGQIKFAGISVNPDSREYRQQVQMVFQDPSGALNPRRSIYESVAEGLRLHGLGAHEEQLIPEALSRVGLRPPEHFVGCYPRELSGGQCQRAVIAGALVLQPRLLVADEPVSMLDASVRGEILRLLLDLRRELGLAILIITHDLGVAWSISDRVAVMYLGRLLEVGPTEALLSSPLHPYTKALLACVPRMGIHLTPSVVGEPPDPSRIPEGCRFAPRCPDAVGAAPCETDNCTRVEPPLVEVAPGHLVACHLTHDRAN